MAPPTVPEGHEHRVTPTDPRREGIFAEKGLVFAVNGASASPPPPTPGPSPPPPFLLGGGVVGVLLRIPEGGSSTQGGGGRPGVRGIWGGGRGRRGPIYRENVSPLFGENALEPRRDPAEPSERPRTALGKTPTEPSERQISSESLAEGCAPRMVTLRNFRSSEMVFLLT